MLWAYLYYYQLTLDQHQQAITQQLGSSADKPVIVYCEKNNGIKQLNDDARKAGIEVGHGLAQAAALCPNVNIIPFNESTESDLLIQLAHRLYPLASDIVLDSHNGMAIRLDNLTHYYGGHAALWKTLTRELMHANTSYLFATAWSVEAAKVLATHGVNTYFEHHDDIKRALESCHLSKTALAPKVIEALARVGITKVHDLLAMPVHELGRRFDNNTITYLTALRGEIFPKASLFRPQTHFDNFIQLPFDIENTQHLHPFITQQLERLSHYLRARNLYTSALTFSIHFREAPVMNIAIQAAMPQASAQSWLTLLTLKIENAVLPEPAVGLTLSCKSFEDIDSDNGDFFNHRFNEVAQKQLIGRLNAKLGDNSTYQPAAADSHQFDGMTVTQSNTANQPYQSDIVPTFTFIPPKPLTQATQVCFGPVRLNSEWWHNTDHKRDYFIAQTSQGVRMLIFKDENAAWWAQGVFC